MLSDTEGEGTLVAEEMFAILGHETRLAILHALWEARDPVRHPDMRPVPFAELRKRVGMADGSQFNYHLKQLVGRFVHQTEDGYVLRRAGEQITSAVLAGALTDEVVLDAVPIDDPCPLCGGSVVLDCGTERTLDFFVVRCTDCEGAFQNPSCLPGTLSMTEFMPPAGVRNRRTVDEMYRAQQTWIRHKLTALIEGVCPECSGTISVTPLICDEHDADTVGDHRVCEHCDSVFEVRFRQVCDICKLALLAPSDRHIVLHPTVAAFYHDHGYETWGHEWLRIGTETIAEQTVVSHDPLEIRVEVGIDADRLDVILDDDGDVIDVRHRRTTQE
ncbi:winged helix-turn-helix domain-containing protein [Haladaptatus sp. NG-SE-30]